jgi:glycosyltransferase involved in cell wall biosynthesis
MRSTGYESPAAGQGGPRVTEPLERLRDLAVKVYLWTQRFKWPLPRALRNMVHGLLGGTIYRAIPDRTDKWPDLPNLATSSDQPVRPAAGAAAASFATSSPPNALVRGGTPHPLRPNFPSRLRCLVATGGLNLAGTEIMVALLGRHLPLHGLDTTVGYAPLATEIGERRADLLHLEGVPFIKLSQHNGRQWLEAHRPDIISVHVPPDWLVAAAAEFGIPTIETIHAASAFFDKKTWPRERMRSQQITGFVAVSERVRRQYLRANPSYPPDRVVTIPNGVDDHHIARRDRTLGRAWLGLGSEFLFVSLARYCLQKNTFGLVTAFSEVASAHPEARLLFAGSVSDSLYFEQVRRLRDSLRCAGRIYFHGPCPDVPTILAAADAFVLNSFWEGGPLVSMEGLCAGLPVVLSEAGGAREQLGEDGLRGFVVANPLGDPEAMDWRKITRARFSHQVNRAALVEAMCAVVKDRDRWRAARDGLAAESQARFSTGLCIQRHAEVLTRAAAGERVLSPIGSNP